MRDDVDELRKLARSASLHEPHSGLAGTGKNASDQRFQHLPWSFSRPLEVGNALGSGTAARFTSIAPQNFF